MSPDLMSASVLVLDPRSSRGVPGVVRAPLRTGAFMAATAGFFGAARVHQSLSRPDDRSAVWARYQRGWFRTLLELFGVRVALAGVGPEASAGVARLVVANHRSTVDVALLGWLFGGKLLSRADLAGWPLLGTVARAAGTIFVDRGSGSSGRAAIRTIRERLAAGDTVSVFPEGTTHTDDVVRPFRRGSFAAAVESEALVVPLGIAYDASGQALFGDESFARHLARVAAAPGLTAAVRIGEAMPPRGDPEALAAAARDAVQALVVEARRDCARWERP